MTRVRLQQAMMACALVFCVGGVSLGQTMATGVGGYEVKGPIFTVGDTIDGYTPPGILDGLGAFRKNKNTIRVIANHELLHFRGYSYEVEAAGGGTFTINSGARLSYFDLNRNNMKLKGAGPAIKRIYDVDGNQASDTSFFTHPGPEDPKEPTTFSGFSRFCSSQLIPEGQFDYWFRIVLDKYLFRKGRTYGLVDDIYFTGEEDGGRFNSIGGAMWALDVKTGNFWHVPDFGHGAWESLTQIDTGDHRTVAFLLADDSSPFDVDGDEVSEAAPMYLYIGRKRPKGDFLARNGLRGGQLYVWVSRTGELTPLDFNGSGTLKGRWVRVNNNRRKNQASGDGSTGYDRFGYPTQKTLWTRAEAKGAFGFSRPEDVATSPYNGASAILASTGVDTYAVGPSGDGADTFGTLYEFKTNFKNLRCDLTIIYDGDADANRKLRSPDNIEWAGNGFVFAQEDEAEEDTLTGEPLFGPGAANPNEAGIVRVNPFTGATVRVANIDRSVILDNSIATPTDAVDVDAGQAGEWESSGIIDVSRLFGKRKGTLFIFDVQAHGIEDQDDFNPSSRINDADLVEGGQLLFLQKKKK